jgi:hypothetical protein
MSFFIVVYLLFIGPSFLTSRLSAESLFVTRFLCVVVASDSQSSIVSSSYTDLVCGRSRDDDDKVHTFETAAPLLFGGALFVFRIAKQQK